MLEDRELGVLVSSRVSPGTASADGGEIERSREWLIPPSTLRTREGGVGYP